jgi:cytochrome c-type biogenesis protein CcmH/NrfG
MNEQDQTRDAQLAEMKSFLAAKVKAEPENAEAWRELAQVKMMEGDIGGAENDCIKSLPSQTI